MSKLLKQSLIYIYIYISSKNYGRRLLVNNNLLLVGGAF